MVHRTMLFHDSAFDMRWKIAHKAHSCGLAIIISYPTDVSGIIHRQLQILPRYLVNQTKPTDHVERYGLMAVVPILTALLLSSLNDLQFFVVFLYALLEFLCTKRCK